jgi:hypothetical protein
MTEQLAVTFDGDAFKAWLNAPNSSGQGGYATNLAANPLLGTAYQRPDGESGWLLHSTLPALLRDQQQTVWTYGPAVTSARVWPTADPEGGADGGVAGAVTVDGVYLSLGRLSDTDLIPTGFDVLPAADVAGHALSVLAERIGHVARMYRANAVDAELVEDIKPPYNGEPAVYSAYEAASAAVDGDVNHPAHPTHW